MFGLTPKLQVSAEERAWIEGGFERLRVLLGTETLRQMTVIPPNDTFFPEWDGTSACADPLLRRVCVYFQIEEAPLTCTIQEDRNAQLMEALPVYAYRGGSEGTGVAYEPDSAEAATVIIRDSLLPYPIALIGELARGAARFRLLGEGRIPANDPDAGPLTDLTTVFYGLGIFTANSAVRFEQTGRRYASSRTGHLSQPQWGHALAEFARLRGETNPKWAKFLGDDIRASFKSSHAVLCREARG